MGVALVVGGFVLLAIGWWIATVVPPRKKFQPDPVPRAHASGDQMPPPLRVR